MDEIEIKAEDEECLSSNIGVYIEPPPFRSIEEATEFLHNHELATNNKYVVQLVRNFSTQGVASMKFPKIRWTYQLVDGNYFDGTPHAIVGIRKYNCQYGNGYREVRQRSEAKQKQKKIDQGRHSGRTRAVAPSKKINCPAQAKMTLIVKFPDYAISENTKAVRSKMGSKMRHEFSDDTQRYILVYLRIFYHHEHGTLPIHLNNDPSKITQAHVASSSTVVLKPGATLRGRSLAGVTAQFSCFVETPSHLAQPSAFQRLEMMPVEELLALYWDLTGQTPNDVFTDTQQEFTDDNLRILLHLCIIFANAESENDGMIVAHRSVRVAGTENDFEPITCFDSNCGVGESHMHCPLCVRQNIFTYSDKLKTHYKKKHVDRSLEYAGLKILRCRDECVVKGLIKDVKAYTSGHWHCWKCDMGYEKLNSSSITHFKSHLIGQTGSVMVTESVFPSVNPHTVVCNLNPAQMETFNIPPNNGLGRPKGSSTQNKNAKALKELNDGYDVSNTAEIQYGADIHDNDNNDDDDDDDADDDTDIHDVISDVIIPANEVNPEYLSMSLPSSLPVGDAVYTLTNGDGDNLLPEYENTVVYVQQDNEEQVFYTTQPDGDGVVIKIPEQDERGLLQEKVAELEQKCLLLERTNLGQKSHITLLNQKIEDLKSKQFTCSDCSAKKTKTDDLLESLKELHTKYRKKHKSQPGSCSVDNELTEGFINLWQEIKELKRLNSSSVVSSNANGSGKSGTISVTPVRGMNCRDSLNDDHYSDGDSDRDDMSDGDLTMFGAESWEGSGNKRRKILHLPLPDNAVELVKKCGKTHSERPDKTQVCRVWSEDDKDKLTQVDKSKQSIEYRVAQNSDRSFSLVGDKSKPNPVSCIQNEQTGVENNVKNSCSTEVVGSVRSATFRPGHDERLNSDIAVSPTVSSSSSIQGVYSHTSSSVVPVTSKVELVMNSDSQKPIVIKSVRLKPQVKEKVNVVKADSVVNLPFNKSSVVQVKESDNFKVGTSVKTKPCDKNLNPSKSVPVNYGDRLSASVNAGKSVSVKTGDKLCAHVNADKLVPVNYDNKLSTCVNTSETLPVSPEVKLNSSKSETELVTSGKKSKTKRTVSDTSSSDLGASSHKKKQLRTVITPQTHAKIKITSERSIGSRSAGQSVDFGMRTRGASTRRGIMWTSPNNSSEDVTPGKKEKSLNSLIVVSTKGK